MRRILVLGGAGFIGEAISTKLCEKNTVTCFDLNLPETLNSKIGAVQADFFKDFEKLKLSLKDIDIVIHCISTTVPANSKTMRYEHETNIKGAINLLDLMVEEKVPYICYLSSGGTVYGDSAKAHEEFHDTAPKCPYGVGKVIIEQLIKYYSRKYEIKHQIWRLSNPYGNLKKTNKSQGVIEAFVNKIENNQPIDVWGEGTAVRDYIYIDDVVSAMELLIYKEFWNETTNIGTGVGVSIKELVSILEYFYNDYIEINKVAQFTGVNVSLISPKKLRDNTKWRNHYSIHKGISKMLENRNA